MARCAHTFRKFREALKAEPEHVKSMMQLISELYDLEEELDKEAISDSARKIRRSEKSKPIARKIRAHLDVTPQT